MGPTRRFRGEGGAGAVVDVPGRRLTQRGRTAMTAAMSSAATLAPPTDAIAELAAMPGLRDVWANMSRREPPSGRPVLNRIIFDTLGIGLEQGLGQLGQESPDWPDFLEWIVATAGAPDPARLARFAAWYHGEPIPAAEQVRQAAVLAMDPVFTPDELAAWDRDGVVVLRHAITRDEAAAIAAHLWTIIDAEPDDPASWSQARVGGIMIQQFQHPAMDVPRRSPRMAKGFAELYGHADLIVSCDRLSFNPPVVGTYAFPGPHLHWDETLTPPIPFETQAILYLTDTAADQGALQVVNGFHHRLAEGWLDTVDAPRLVDFSDEAVTVPAGAGDLVIWRHEIPHGASANTSDRPRLAQYVNHYPMRWPDGRAWV